MNLRDFFRLVDVPTHDWQERAACATVADPRELVETSEDTHPVCLRCPVLKECGDHADAHDERFGIWGGVNRSRRN